MQDCSSFEGDKCCGKQVIGVFNLERKYYIHFKSKNEGKDDIKLKKKTWNQTASPYVDWKIYSLPKVFQGFYFRKLISKSDFDEDDSNNYNNNNSNGAQTFSFRDDH